MDEMINVSLKWDDAFLILKQLEYRRDFILQLQNKIPEDPFFKERLEEIERVTECFSLASGIKRFI